MVFQLLCLFKKDLAVLDDSLAVLPPVVGSAFEFRYASLHDVEVFGRLRSRRLALRVTGSERLTIPTELTADCAYFRFATKGNDRVISPAGQRRSPRKRLPAVRYSSLLNTKTKAGNPSWSGCSLRRFRCCPYVPR